MNQDRLHMLEERVQHTDKRVTELAQGVATIQTSQASMAAVLDKVADRVNAPNTTNYFGIIGAVVSLVTILGLGIALYTSPIQARLDRLQGVMEYEVIDEQKDEGHRATLNEKVLSLEKAEKRDYLDDAKVAERLAKLEREVSAGRVSRQAIGDYLKESRGVIQEHITSREHSK